MRTRQHHIVVVGASSTGFAVAGSGAARSGACWDLRQTSFEEAGAMVRDPVCGMTVDESKAAATAVYRGQTYHFCSQGCKATFDKAPEKYAAR